MNEINKHILQQAIRELPKHSPPGIIWDNIEEDLLVLEQEDQISEKVSELPEYDPPAMLWDNILEEIEAGPAGKQGKVIPFGWRQVISYAAVASGVILGVFWLGSTSSDTSITYSEEMIEETFLANDWDADEEDFEVVLAELDENPINLQIPQIQQLRLELEELNEAKVEIEELIEAYGTDEEIVDQIREIELERTDIIKKLAVFI
jgi:hypothetical protein